MIFTQTAEYALRAIVCLAETPDVPKTTEELAKTTRVPANYLSKLMQTLRKHGLVEAKRGVGGGFLLTRSPAAISILDVFDIVDPLKRIETCPLGIESHGTCLCPMHKCLDEAIAQIQTTFRETTVADLLNTESASQPMCESALGRLHTKTG